VSLKQWQELRRAFVGEVHTSVAGRADVCHPWDRFGESPGPLEWEEHITGAPGDEAGYQQSTELGVNRWRSSDDSVWISRAKARADLRVPITG
jgi:hypothetical protein